MSGTVPRTHLPTPHTRLQTEVLHAVQLAALADDCAWLPLSTPTLSLPHLQAELQHAVPLAVFVDDWQTHTVGAERAHLCVLCRVWGAGCGHGAGCVGCGMCMEVWGVAWRGEGCGAFQAEQVLQCCAMGTTVSGRRDSRQPACMHMRLSVHLQWQACNSRAQLCVCTMTSGRVCSQFICLWPPELGMP
eukprot:364969-Chlamydomonas_euryale.AAC.1